MAWAQQWFDGFLKPLFAEGLFLPPQFAFDLRSAAERGERRYGQFAGLRADLSNWKEFMLWMHSVTVERLPSGTAARAEMRNASAMRIARRLALNLMGRVDVSAFRVGEQFDAYSAVLFEVQRLQGDAQAAERFAPVCSIITEAVRVQRFNDLVPFCESHAANDRRTIAIDPFLQKLLIVPGSERAALAEPPVQGRILHADSPRKILAAAGEFAGRDLGGLPDNLGRLTPTELLLLHEAFRSDKDQQPIIESEGFRTLFLLRASQSGLLQRFHFDTELAHTEPTVYLQIELVDDPNDHRLSDPPRPPLISYYRAVVVHLFHQFARIAEEFQWSLHGVIAHNSWSSRNRVVLESREVQELSASIQKAFDTLVLNCPSAFVATRCHSDSRRTQPNAPAGDFDLAIRMVVGRESHDRDDQLPWLRTQARNERGVRVELRRDGTWGWSSSDDCASTECLDVLDFSWDIDDPAAMATQLILKTLGVEPVPPDLEIK
ncbi:hypothetical protein [Schlesneria sp. DSM 10557]|uniref:hypothetical protein n=1 Tax=Schlesneria sp. DSM 10557 TaxID=3044399 RepID=UPI0035A0C295